MRIVIALAVAWGSLFQLGGRPLSAQSLAGVVTDSLTGDSLAYVQVYLEGTDWGVLSDDSGYYALYDVTPNTYTVVVRYPRYHTIRQVLVLTEPFEVAVVDFRLRPMTEPDFTIHLRSRTFTPDVGHDFSPAFLDSIRAGSTRHVFVQFQSGPDADSWDELASRGLRLLSYVTGNAYTAAVNDIRVVQEWQNYDIRWIAPILINDKLHPDVASENFGQWAVVSPGRVRLVVSFFEDVSQQDITDILDAHVDSSSSIGGVRWRVVMSVSGIRDLAAEDAVSSIHQINPPPPPANFMSRSVVRTESVQKLEVQQFAGSVSYQYRGLTGDSVRIGIMEPFYDQHEDYKDRVFKASSGPATHGTQVAGIVAGSGEVGDQRAQQGAQIGHAGACSASASQEVPFAVVTSAPPLKWRGHAPKALIGSYFGDNWDLGPPFADSVIITDHSILQLPAHEYASDAFNVDNEIVKHNLYVVAAAGNNGVYPSESANLAGYYSLSGSKAKNSTAVGNYSSWENRRYQHSSMGPTFDGRLKPDIMAPGHNVISTYYPEDYYCDTGSSFSSPVVAGIMALMVQSFKENVTRKRRPLNSTMKAILIHTAEDLVDSIPSGPEMNPDTDDFFRYLEGPDWATGYGLVDAVRAVDLITSDELYLEDAISKSGDKDLHGFLVDAGMDTVRVTLAWDDFPMVDISGDTAPDLVNDLDLLVYPPHGDPIRPLVLPALPDPAPPGYKDAIPAGLLAAAHRGVDDVNVVEQVVVVGPAVKPGRWKAEVRGHSLKGQAQKYSLVLPSRRVPPGSVALSLHGGLAVPFGSLNKTTNAGPTVNFDVLYWLSPRFWADMRGGLSLFTGSGRAANVDIWNLSGNIRFTPFDARPRPFINAGLGLYYFDDLEAGFNVGIGVGFPLGSRLELELTSNYHQILSTSPDVRFSKILQLGLVWWI